MQFPSTCLIDFYLFQFLTNSDNGDGRVEEKKYKKLFILLRGCCAMWTYFFSCSAVFFFVAGIMVKEDNL